jgi:outer membrane protein
MRAFFRAAPVALALVAILSGSAAAQSGQKSAYIQSNILIEQAPGRAEAEAQWEKETLGYQGEIKRMSDSLNTLVTAFEKRQAALSATARETQAKDIQAKEAGYQTRTRDLQQRAQSRQAELIQPILDRVKAAIEEVRVEGGYTFVFNLDQGSPIVAYDKNLNLNDKVLAKLRAGAPVTASKPAAGAAAPAPAGVTRPQTPPLD